MFGVVNVLSYTGGTDAKNCCTEQCTESRLGKLGLGDIALLCQLRMKVCKPTKMWNHNTKHNTYYTNGYVMHPHDPTNIQQTADGALQASASISRALVQGQSP